MYRVWLQYKYLGLLVIKPFYEFSLIRFKFRPVYIPIKMSDDENIIPLIHDLVEELLLKDFGDGLKVSKFIIGINISFK